MVPVVTSSPFSALVIYKKRVWVVIEFFLIVTDNIDGNDSNQGVRKSCKTNTTHSNRNAYVTQPPLTDLCIACTVYLNTFPKLNKYIDTTRRGESIYLSATHTCKTIENSFYVTIPPPVPPSAALTPGCVCVVSFVPVCCSKKKNNPGQLVVTSVSGLPLCLIKVANCASAEFWIVRARILSNSSRMLSVRWSTPRRELVPDNERKREMSHGGCPK